MRWPASAGPRWHSADNDPAGTISKTREAPAQGSVTSVRLCSGRALYP